MAFAAGAALLQTGSIAAAGALGVGAGFATIGAALKYFLVSTAIGAAINALTPKPEAPKARGYTVTARGSNLDHQIIYGETRVAGVIAFDSLSNGLDGSGNARRGNRFLHRVQVMAGHEISSYEAIYIDSKKVTSWKTEDGTTTGITDISTYLDTDTPLIPEQLAEIDDAGNVIAGSTTNPYGPDNAIAIRMFSGSPTQAASASLVAEIVDGSWTTDHRLRGLAYMYVRFGYRKDVYPTGLPEVTAVIRGKKVFDPRDSSTAWSDNPALCLRDYLTADFGLAEPSSRIDDSLVGTAANVCDQTADDSTTRFTCNGAFTTGTQPYDTINSLLSSMGGLLWYAQGEWRMKPAYWTAPVESFDEGDLRSSIELSTRHSRKDNFNTITGNFRGPESKYQVTGFPPVSNAAFLTADNNEESSIDLDLPFTDTTGEARRIARIALERNRQQLTFSATFGIKALSVQIGDNVQITLDRFGWTNKTFEVTEWSFGLQEGGNIHVDMTLREISENVFDEVDDGVVFENDNSQGFEFDFGLIVGNLTATPFTRQGAEGQITSGATLEWDAIDNGSVDYYEVQWKRDTDTAYNTTTSPETTFDLTNLVTGIDYDVRVRGVTVTSQRGPYASLSFTAGVDDSIPNAPTNLNATGQFQAVRLTWTAVTQNTDSTDFNDFRRYNIYRSLDTNFLNASLVGTSPGESHIDGGLDNGTTYYHWVSVVDTSGNESATVGPSTATTQRLSAEELVEDIRSQINAVRVDNVSSLPTEPFDYEVGDYVYLTTDGKLYQLESVGPAVWTPVVGDIPPASITATEIGPNSISTGAIQTNAITSAKILAGEVVAGKLAADSVIAGNINTASCSADILSATQAAITNLAAINADLGTVVAGSIRTTSSPANPGIVINYSDSVFDTDNAVYVYQNDQNVYGLFVQNSWPFGSGGGACQIKSKSGFTLQVITENSSSGVTAIDARNAAASGGEVQLALSSANGGYGVFIPSTSNDGGLDASGGGWATFTGVHLGMMDKTVACDPGDILLDTRIVAKSISDCFTEVTRSTSANQKASIGILQRKKDWIVPPAFIDREATRALAQSGTTPESTQHELVLISDPSQYHADYDMVAINSLGEGEINVCGRNGDIEAGDLIVTSTLPGKGMKQDDDIVRSYTVARAREAVTFSDPDEVKMVACIYLCG